ncbi:FAD-binding oxidoreductase [Acinetobacter sp. 1000160]|uniref:FAD-binding oxidoreductase n=1 Tax=Acinetobacter sp. 1000160 TaxID=1310800 RepID=UPI000449B6F2|nr:FAD-binding oxidoreductase [Acinetobacter sp. 1000160]EXB47888.1 FAD binding domain protein [Acinetobacter baumannii 146457]EYT19720.1 FAD binding domain protein [Acinetobacter sp. 1000160]
MKTIQAWGRLSNTEHQVIPLITPVHAFKQIRQETFPGIAHGMGRSYGDVALNGNGVLWLTTAMNHLISFDLQTGILHCEAGATLQDIQRTLIPQGWMLPVTPGTQMITVGGAIANDVHGKNHHAFGSFGDHVLYIKLLRTDGEIIECSKTERAEWFYATVAGIGLTGIILEVKIQLRPVQSSWIDAETIPYHNLDEFFALSDSSEPDWEYTVSWIDCMNGANAKGLFSRGNLAGASTQVEPAINDKTFPITPPVSLVNKLSLPVFNFAYFHGNSLKSQQQKVHYEPFFYPLDAMHEWNKMYGPKGFYQYQSVVPKEIGKEVTQEMLNAIKKSGEGSFLAVLKTFGDRESGGLLSFPKPGVTLALDFPNRGEKTLKLLNELDHIVAQAQGRLYLAKDARMPRSLFEAGYPQLNEFLKYRDPGISSEMSRRLLGA